MAGSSVTSLGPSSTGLGQGSQCVWEVWGCTWQPLPGLCWILLGDLWQPGFLAIAAGPNPPADGRAALHIETSSPVSAHPAATHGVGAGGRTSPLTPFPTENQT